MFSNTILTPRIRDSYSSCSVTEKPGLTHYPNSCPVGPVGPLGSVGPMGPVGPGGLLDFYSIYTFSVTDALGRC